MGIEEAVACLHYSILLPLPSSYPISFLITRRSMGISHDALKRRMPCHIHSSASSAGESRQ